MKGELAGWLGFYLPAEVLTKAGWIFLDYIFRQGGQAYKLFSHLPAGWQVRGGK